MNFVSFDPLVSGEKKDFSGNYYKTTKDEELIKHMKEIGKYGV